MKQTIDITDSIFPLLSSFISALFIAAFFAYQIIKWRKESLEAYFARFWNSLVVWSTQGLFNYARPFFRVADSAKASAYSSPIFIVVKPSKMVVVNALPKANLYPTLSAKALAFPALHLTKAKVVRAIYTYKH